MREVLTWSELVQHAGSSARARLLLQERRWWRVLRDAYAPADVPDLPATRLEAVRRVLPPGAAVSHRSCLWLLGVPVLDDVERLVVEVTAPRGRHLTRAGLATTAALLPDADLCVLDGLPVTSAARAVVDVARREPLLDAVAVGDAALRSGATTPALVDDVLSRSRRLPGVPRAREVVALLDGRSESVLESRARVALVRSGLEPEPQVDVYDDDGRHLGRVDLLVDGIAVECDGRASRLDPVRFQRDRERQREVLAAGLPLVRWTWQDVVSRPPERLRADVEEAARAAAGSLPRWRRGPSTQRPPRLLPLPSVAQTAALQRSA